MGILPSHQHFRSSLRAFNSTTGFEPLTYHWVRMPYSISHCFCSLRLRWFFHYSFRVWMLLHVTYREIQFFTLTNKTEYDIIHNFLIDWKYSQLRFNLTIKFNFGLQNLQKFRYLNFILIWRFELWKAVVEALKASLSRMMPRTPC